MTIPEPLQTFVEPLTALQRLLERFGEQGVIIGGIATAFLGRPRFTVDLDAMFLDLPATFHVFWKWQGKRALNRALTK